jgi:hypothetical protein
MSAPQAVPFKGALTAFLRIFRPFLPPPPFPLSWQYTRMHLDETLTSRKWLILWYNFKVRPAAPAGQMGNIMVNSETDNIFNRILEAWNSAKNSKRFAKSGGRKI